MIALILILLNIIVNLMPIDITTKAILNAIILLAIVIVGILEISRSIKKKENKRK